MLFCAQSLSERGSLEPFNAFWLLGRATAKGTGDTWSGSGVPWNQPSLQGTGGTAPLHPAPGGKGSEHEEQPTNPTWVWNSLAGQGEESWKGKSLFW